MVNPVEQYLIRTGKRLFKGYEDYDELCRMSFDLETEGLDPKRHRINQIGVHTNKGFDFIIDKTKVNGNNDDDKEVAMIHLFFRCINKLLPDVVSGHNSENFDWEFIFTRLEVLNIDIKKLLSKLFVCLGTLKSLT